MYHAHKNCFFAALGAAALTILFRVPASLAGALLIASGALAIAGGRSMISSMTSGSHEVNFGDPDRMPAGARSAHALTTGIGLIGLGGFFIFLDVGSWWQTRADEEATAERARSGLVRIELTDARDVRGLAADYRGVYLGTTQQLKTANPELESWAGLQVGRVTLVTATRESLWWLEDGMLHGQTRDGETVLPNEAHARGVVALAPAGEHVVFLAPGRLAETDLDGETRELARVELVPGRDPVLAVTRTSVFYGPTTECAVLRIELAAEEPVATCAAKDAVFTAVASDGERAYALTNDTLSQFALTTSGLFELGGKGLERVATVGGSRLAVDRGEAFIAAPERIVKRNLVSGAETTIFELEPGETVTHLALGTTRVYWVSGNSLSTAYRTPR